MLLPVDERIVMRSLLSSAIGALAFVLLTSPALAQAPETEGERLFRLGRAAMLDGRFDEACPTLAESQRLEPHVGTLLNLAACDERRGHYGSAWVEYQKALTAARAEGQADRVQLAETRIAAIEPRVPWLRVSAPRDAVSDLVITLDTGDLVRPAWGTEMPVDPGSHLVVATSDGKRVFEEKIDIREGEHRTVTVAVAASSIPEGPRPEHVIIEPKPPATEAPAAKPLGRWILEPGIFVGFMTGSASHPRPTGSGAGGVTIERLDGAQQSNCASFNCSLGELERGAGIVGVSFFGGYALSEHVGIGLRILGAPQIAGGGFFAFGPSVVLRATSALSIGVFGAFGDASFSGNAMVNAPAGFRITGGGPSTKAEGTLAGGAVVGLDVSLKIVDLQRGAIALTAMPAFFTGNGSAFALPLGVAYRFQ